MNLIDPHTITPEVLRRAVDLYCGSVPLQHRPMIWNDDTNDLGVDGRFNLSRMGRFIEEAIILDAISGLAPSADIACVEQIVRKFMAVERPKIEYERFIVALKTALGLNRVQTEALIRPITRAMAREVTAMIPSPKERA